MQHHRQREEALADERSRAFRSEVSELRVGEVPTVATDAERGVGKRGPLLERESIADGFVSAPDRADEAIGEEMLTREIVDEAGRLNGEVDVAAREPSLSLSVGEA